MPAYGFFDLLEVTDPEKLERYRQAVGATVARFGGRYLSVGGRCDAIEGRWRPVFPVLIEFPSLQHAHGWYGSPEYRELKALRLAATRCSSMVPELSCSATHRQAHRLGGQAMADKPIEVTGGCLCGEVRYKAQVLLRSAYICHCRTCQKSTGQPAEIAVPIKAGTLKFIKGEPRFYASSAHGRRAFCGACGSRLAWQALDSENDWLSSVNVGSLDNAADALAECHIFADRQLPWYRVNDSLPKYREAEADALLERWREERLGRRAS